MEKKDRGTKGTKEMRKGIRKENSKEMISR
jgi:hypothetical protein